MAFEENGKTATVKVIVEPLIPWIWFGGLVVVMGAVIGLFQGGRRTTVPVATRTSEAPRVSPPPEPDAEPVMAAP
jgi:cytochrome c-type biogenesis protein CcmF